jgi:hypothetical protein
MDGFEARKGLPEPAGSCPEKVAPEKSDVGNTRRRK